MLAAGLGTVPLVSQRYAMSSAAIAITVGRFSSNILDQLLRMSRRFVRCQLTTVWLT